MFMSEMMRCEGVVIIIFMACSPSAATWMLRKPSVSSASRTSRRLVVVSSTTRILNWARSDMARYSSWARASVRETLPGLAGGQHAVERDQADHPPLHRDHALHEGAGEFGGDVGGRLDRAGGDGQDVGDGIDEQADGLVADLGDDDDVAGAGLGRREAEAVGEVDDGKHGAAQVDDALHVGGRMRQRRRRGPAANVADRHDVEAEFLLSEAEGDQLAGGRRLLSVCLHHAAFLFLALSERAGPATMASTSRMTATRPSPRIVAPATPKTWP